MPHWRWSAAIASTACWTIRRWRASIKTSGSATARCWTPTPACCRMRSSGRRCVRMSAIWRSCSVKIADPMPEAAARLEVFASNNSDMVQATRAVVYSRGQQLQQEIAERGQFFGWQALVLFLLSLGAGATLHPHDYRPGERHRKNDQSAGGREVAGRRRIVYRPARAAIGGQAHHLAQRAPRRGWSRSGINFFAICRMS